MQVYSNLQFALIDFSKNHEKSKGPNWDVMFFAN